ncbi:MAG: CRISPR-associated protein Cas4 [Firmicutes bacterium]|nr:CRISPR-associated protein Cas4 [Bacillota bacterium]
MKSSDAPIAIRTVQHYMYCPHRWGLMEIDKVWSENYFVTRANIIHERVHDPKRDYSSRGKKVFTSVSVFCDEAEYNIYGVTDCIEAAKDAGGVSLDGSAEKYKLTIVEYKPTQPRSREYNEDDLMQVFAQKICVDYVFGCDSEGVLYYADVKKRIPLPLRENFSEYDELLRRLLREMREKLASGTIPPIAKGQKCAGCSMRDICMPSLKKSGDFLTELRKIGEESL